MPRFLGRLTREDPGPTPFGIRGAWVFWVPATTDFDDRLGEWRSGKTCTGRTADPGHPEGTG